MFKFVKTWEARWHDHDIVVRNWWNPFLQCGESLAIDGKIVDEKSGWGKIAEDLQGQICEGETSHRVKAHLGSVDCGLHAGCHIMVDDTLVGGDRGKELLS